MPNEEVIAQLLQRLDGHSGRLNQTERTMERISGQMERTAKIVETLDHKVNGNGDIGMDEQLRVIMDWIRGQKDKESKREKEQRDSQLYYLRLTVGTAIAAFVMLLFNGLVYFVKIWPVIENLSK